MQRVRGVQKWTWKKGRYRNDFTKWSEPSIFGRNIFRSQHLLFQSRKGEPLKKLTRKNHFWEWSWAVKLYFRCCDFSELLINFALKPSKMSSLAPLALATMVSVWHEQKWVLVIDENFESASSRCFRRNTMKILSSNKHMTNSVWLRGRRFWGGWI